MDDTTAFDRLLASEVLREAGPPQHVNDADVYLATRAAIESPWRLRFMFGPARFAFVAVVVALFGGLLLAGVMTTQPSEQGAPGVGASTSAAVGTVEPTPGQEPGPSVSADAANQVYESTARLIVDPGPSPTVQDLTLAQAALTRYEALVRSGPVVDAVIDRLKLEDEPGRLLERISTDSSADTLTLSISVRDNDADDARRLALALGLELTSRVRNELFTRQVPNADAAIAADRASIRVLQKQLDRLRRKKPKTALDRQEIIALTGQISALQRDIQLLQPNSSAYVRNNVKWLERPTSPTQPVPSEEPTAAIPLREVVVATQPIPRGTRLEAEMLTTRAVPSDETNEMALSDVESAVGEVAAIDIAENQAISPNMLGEG